MLEVQFSLCDVIKYKTIKKKPFVQNNIIQYHHFSSGPKHNKSVASAIGDKNSLKIEQVFDRILKYIFKLNYPQHHHLSI